MSQIKPENYFVVSGWMITELNLKGNELLVFAIIYGFCQNDNLRGVFNGSIQYLSDFTGSCKKTVINSLQSLVSKGFIEKRDEYRNNVKFCTYAINATVVQKLHGGSVKITSGYCKNYTGGSEEITSGGSVKITPNNIVSDNIFDRDIYNSTDTTPTGGSGAVSPQSVIDCFHSICQSYPKVRTLSDARRKAIQARLRTYGLDTIREVFEKAEASDFLKGKNDKNWSADFDWIMTDRNFAKILEGKYANRGGNQHGEGTDAADIATYKGYRLVGHTII